jgi:beta-glucanase (GH16 family)
VSVAALVLSGLVLVPWEASLSARRPGWQLVLHDEFDGGTVDGSVWNVQDLASPRNNELQYYAPHQVTVAAGRLRLTSDRTPAGDRMYSSAAVDTYGTFSFTYGRVEIRARLPEMGQGVWPALWLLGAGCNPVGGPCPWPTAGSNEIDVMEAVNDPTTFHTNLHYGTAVGTSLSPGPDTWTHPGLSKGFHTYAVEWEPGGVVRWYLDEDLLGQRTAPGFLDQPMYLLMNTAIGGDWPGPPDASTPFPQHFDIEHVRVYQRR